MDISPDQMAWLAIAAGFLAVAAQLKWVKELSGKNRDKARYGFGAICLILLYMGGATVIQGWMAPASSPGGGGGQVVVTPTACGVACPTSGSTTVTFNYQNVLDTSAATTFDVTMKCTAAAGVVTQSDTTSGTGTYNCGSEYTCKVLSTTGDQGDASTVVSILTGGGASVTADGDLKFTACSATQSLLVGGFQHGVPVVRAWDVDTAAWMYDAADSQTYSATDGASFSAGSSATAKVVGANGKMDIRLDVEAATAYTALNDRGILFLVKAPVSEWDSSLATFLINGQVANCQKSANLNPEEQTAYDSYQYACKYSGTDRVGSTSPIQFELKLQATGGANPSTDVEVDIAMIGQYASISNGNIYKVGAVDDSSSKTQVYGLHDTKIDIS